MKLLSALELAESCGLTTVFEAVVNVDHHAMNIFKYEEIKNEIDEILDELSLLGIYGDKEITIAECRKLLKDNNLEVSMVDSGSTPPRLVHFGFVQADNPGIQTPGIPTEIDFGSLSSDDKKLLLENYNDPEKTVTIFNLPEDKEIIQFFNPYDWTHTVVVGNNLESATFDPYHGYVNNSTLWDLAKYRAEESDLIKAISFV